MSNFRCHSKRSEGPLFCHPERSEGSLIRDPSAHSLGSRGLRITKKCKAQDDSKRGFILLLVLILMTVLSAVSGALIVSLTADYRTAKVTANDAQAFWLAEAGMRKAIWNLMTTPANGGLGEDWTTAGTTEALGGGTYKMVVARYDFSLSVNGSVASSSPVQPIAAKDPTKAIDADDTTFWESLDVPKVPDPQELIIAFPYTLTINKVRFLAAAANNRPKRYTLEVSNDNVVWTTVINENNNPDIDVLIDTDEFGTRTGVNYLKLRITGSGQGNSKSQIATFEALGSKITSTGTVNLQDRATERTVAVDDATTAAHNQIDWNEIAP
jgi:type II secretory pathway pseudopilin PulG